MVDISLNRQLDRFPRSIVMTSSLSDLFPCQRSRAFTATVWHWP